MDTNNEAPEHTDLAVVDEAAPPAQLMQPQQMSAAEIVQQATEWSKALIEIVNRQELYSVISGKKFPLAEAWEVVEAFDSTSRDTEYCKLVYEGDEAMGYEAKVNLIRNGGVIASGIMVCGFDDFPCRGKNGYAKHRAAMSSAQTWAGNKASRQKYAFVFKLAGFEPTPADEMKDETGAAPQSAAKPQNGRRRKAAKPKAKTVDTNTGEILDGTGGPRDPTPDQTSEEAFRKLGTAAEVDPDDDGGEGPIEAKDQGDFLSFLANYGDYADIIPKIIPFFNQEATGDADVNLATLRRVADEHSWELMKRKVVEELGEVPSA